MSFYPLNCCFWYTTNLHPSHKFDSCTRKCIFVDYPIRQKAYGLYDLNNHQFFSCGNVIFHKEVFPFHAPKTSSESTISQLELIKYHIDSPPLTNTPKLPLPETTAILHSSSPTTSTTLPLCGSERVRKPSIHLQDFHYGQTSTLPTNAYSIQESSTKLGTRYPLSNYISYDTLPPHHKHFVNTISSILEPISYAQAVTDPKWQDAIQLELDALNAQKTWSLVLLSSGHHPIGSKWYTYQKKFQ